MQRAASYQRLLTLLLLVSVVGGCAVSRCPRMEVVGGTRTLDVATWNVMRFGNDGLAPDDEIQIANVACVVKRSGVDLWALQEVEDRSDFHRLLSELGPDWEGMLDNSAANLHLGFLYRPDVVQPLSIQTILQDESHAFAGRPPLLMEAEVTLPGGRSAITFVNLHMKAFDDARSFARRSRAAEVLKAHLDAPAMRNTPLIVLGDFNDRLTASIHQGAESPYRNFLADTAGYYFATFDLDARGDGTYCFNTTCTRDSAIDHILVSDELFDAMQGGALRYDALLEAIPEYVRSTSDHLPAVLRLNLP